MRLPLTVTLTLCEPDLDILKMYLHSAYQKFTF